jgi:hypothetical protein
MQDHDKDLLPTEKKVCTGKCEILKSDTSGLEAACPSINVVKPNIHLSAVNSVDEGDLGETIFAAHASKESKVESPYPVDFVRLGFHDPDICQGALQEHSFQIEEVSQKRSHSVWSG